uniref:Trafficking protein particle complex subunit 11 domain-containing protein n=1 Tax=Auxenochlorella protothecoides TaxID=3075 RepID=A0A1D2AC11_AUXPR
MEFEGFQDPPLPVVGLLGDLETQQLLIALAATDESPAVRLITVPDAQQSPEVLGPRPPSPSEPVTRKSYSQVYKQHSFEALMRHTPGALAVLLRHGDVMGDPKAWATCSQAAAAARTAARTLQARLMVVVTSPTAPGQLAEDRISMLCRQADVDRKSILALHMRDQVGMAGVLSTLVQAAQTSYLDAAVRHASKHPPTTVAGQECGRVLGLKLDLGLLLEMGGRPDEAMTAYELASSFIPRIMIQPPGLFQRFFELHLVSEALTFKLMALVPPSPRHQDTVLKHFTRLTSLFGTLPSARTPKALALAHAQRLALQHEAVAGHLIGRPAPGQERGLGSVAALLHAAARHAGEADALSRQPDEGPSPVMTDEVVPGQYLGCWEFKHLDRPLTDDEFATAVGASLGRAPRCPDPTDLLRCAVDLLESSPAAGIRRQLVHARQLLGQGLARAGRHAEALAVMPGVAEEYRRQGWASLLLDAVKQCEASARLSGDEQARAAAQLELCALRGAPAESCMEAIGAVLATPPGTMWQVEGASSGWLSVLQIAVGLGPAARRGGPELHCALRCVLACPLRLEAVAALPGRPGSEAVPLVGRDADGGAAPAGVLELAAGSWTRLTARLPVTCASVERILLTLAGGGQTLVIHPAAWTSGECTLALGPASSIPSLNQAPLPPSVALLGAATGGPAPVGHDDLPTLALHAPAFGLVGEGLTALLTLHAGEAQGLQGAVLTPRSLHREEGRPVDWAIHIEGAEVAPLSDGGVALPTVAPGAMLVVKLRWTSQHAGSIDLRCLLQYPVPAGAAGQVGHCVVAGTIKVHAPFTFQTTLSTLPGALCRLPPGEAGAPLPSSPSDVLPEHGDSPVAGAARSSVPAAGAPSATRRLPAGQPCMVRLTLRAAAPCGLHVELCELRLSPALRGARGAAAGPSAAARCGPIDAAPDDALALVASFAAPAGRCALGTLHARWRRCDEAVALQSSAGRGGEALGAAELERLHALAPSVPCEEVETVSDLGSMVELVVADLRVDAAFPGSGQLGQPLPLSLEIQNPSVERGADVSFELLDARGFMVAGVRSAVTHIGPGAKEAVRLTLVPYHVGLLPLPSLRVEAGDWAVDALASQQVFVEQGPFK